MAIHGLGFHTTTLYKSSYTSFYTYPTNTNFLVCIITTFEVSTIMNSPEVAPEEAVSSALHRSPKTLDFAKLLHDTKPESALPSGEQQKNDTCDPIDVIYLKSEKRAGRTKSARRSLSNMSNQTSRHLDGSSDEMEALTDDQHFALSIIDKEISEWQHTCQTGRPLWWLPESRYSRARNLNPWLPDQPDSRIWFKDTEAGPNPVYSKARRTVSESHLTNTEAPDDLAHIIAIQLLGSCFTLPLDSMGYLPFSTSNEDGHPNLPDPRMISSLRMHTHFRYSPCFGHEQRNSSPAQVFPELYDGTSPLHTTIPTSAASRKHEGKVLAEDSTGDDSCSAKYLRSRMKKERSYIAGTKEWCVRNGFKKNNSRVSDQASSSTDLDLDRDTRLDGHQNSGAIASKKLNYRLQSVIRSEPHPVFVQPVKELAVRRLKASRRHFGGSLHGALCSHESRETESGSEYGSPGMSSDARMRRLRAQEQGEIRSRADVDSVGVQMGNSEQSNSPAAESFSEHGRDVTPWYIPPPDPLKVVSVASPPLEASLRGQGNILMGADRAISLNLLKQDQSASSPTVDGVNMRRPKFSRTSTSGTQVFSPGEDGLEVNQSPVGPDRDHWDAQGSRREQSFL